MSHRLEPIGSISAAWPGLTVCPATVNGEPEVTMTEFPFKDPPLIAYVRVLGAGRLMSTEVGKKWPRLPM